MKLLLLLILILSTVALKSQVPDFKCGFDDMMNANPERAKALEQQTMAWKNLYNRTVNKRDFIYSYDTIFEVKVVFHILYNNASENIPDSTIYSQMQVLNEDFNRLNADTSKTRSVFLPVAGKLNIRFVLADKDPNGMPTDGIIRKFTNVTSFSQTNAGNYDSRMKYNNQGGDNAWNTDQYLNIWICDMYPQGASSFTAGYATPPQDAEHWNATSLNFPKSEQGVAIHYYTIGRYNSAATANNAFGLGRTLVHELGHYFGLFHIWGLNNTSCDKNIDDFIDDTPNTRFQASSCNYNNTCNDGAGDLPDPIENYMDYSWGSCQNMFTKQQASLMLFNIHNYRKSIYTPIVTKDSYETIEPVAIVPRIISNPSRLITVIANKYSKAEFEVTIVDVIGKLVMNKLQFQLNNPTPIAETEYLLDGHYFVRLKNIKTDEVFNFRWVKAGGI